MRSTAAAVAVVGAAGASARGSVYERVQKRACALRNKWTIASLRWQKQSAALRHTPKAALLTMATPVRHPKMLPEASGSWRVSVPVRLKTLGMSLEM